MKIKLAVEFEVDVPYLDKNTSEYLNEDKIEDVVYTIEEAVINQVKGVKPTDNYLYTTENDEDYDHGVF